MNYDISTNLCPTGGTSEGELVWLNKQASRYDSIVELGSWMGRSTHALCSTGAKVVAIDKFDGFLDHRAFKHRRGRPGGTYEIFMDGMKDFKNLEVLRMDSADAASRFEDNSIDMVFIDADHTYEGFKRDFDAWLPKCKKFFCGHDAYEMGIPAVLEESKIDWKAGAGKMWFSEKPGYEIQTDTSIIYYTDNNLPEEFASKVRRFLVKAAAGKPIITVSQKLVDFGENVCVGEIGRSHLSMYRQILAGAEKAKTKYVALAEHDCLYTPEHFNWEPPNETDFFYNLNHYFVQWNNRRSGEYSRWRRRPLSMLIAGREALIQAVKEKLWMLENGYMIRKGMAGACEPGQALPQDAFVANLLCEPGIKDRDPDYVAGLAEFKDLGKEMGRWTAWGFNTRFPNLDIRHGGNFSGGRRGKTGCVELPYWGKFKETFNA